MGRSREERLKNLRKFSTSLPNVHVLSKGDAAEESLVDKKRTPSNFISDF
jgi:hypothetical protein